MTRNRGHLVVTDRDFFLEVFNEFNADLRRFVALQNVQNKLRFNAYLNLWESSSLHGVRVCASLLKHTISSAPRKTPQRTLLNHSPPSIASSGSSTNSTSGFSSSVSVKDGWDPVAAAVCCPCPLAGVLDRGEAGGSCECVTAGVTSRNELKPTCAQRWTR
jgi:hypothetical protein